ncbi:MAG: peptidyl-prolyl cis-trans isomerase [Pseudomonadota bacterium]
MEFFRSLLANKFVGGFLLGIIILGMAVWGIEDIFTGGVGSNVIRAGERGLDINDVNRRFEDELNRLRREQTGNAITRQQAVQAGILDEVFGREAARLTSLGFAREIGADASAKAVTDTVREIEAFQNAVTGEFDLETYRRVLAQNQFAQSQFEDDLADDLTITNVREGVEAAIVAPTALARPLAILQAETRTASWFALSRDALEEPDAPTDEDLQAFFSEFESAFAQPERRALSLLSVTARDFLHQAEVSEEEIEAVYEATKTRRLATPEQRTFEEARYATEEAARNAFGALSVGADIATTNPVFVETKTAVERDIAIEEFREDLFSETAGIGAVSGPFEVAGGYILGRVTAIEPGEPKPLDDVRDEITEEIAAEQAEAKFYDAFNQMDDLIGRGLTLAEMGAEFGAPVVSFLPVDRRGVSEDGVTIRALLSAADGLAQAFELPEGTVGDRFDGDQSIYVVSVDQIVPARTPALEDIRDRVLTAYQANAEQEALQLAADAVKERIETAAASLDDEAESYGAAVSETTTPLRRTVPDQSVPIQIAQAVFNGAEGDVLVVRGDAADEVYIVQVGAIERPDAAQLDLLAPVSRSQISTQLSNDILFAFEQQLREEIELVTDDAAYAAYRTRLLEDQ